jgi:5-methylcytosine-specific restriction enzyme A
VGLRFRTLIAHLLHDRAGEGQVGDMEFVRGNRAVRNHAKDGKDLHLFEALGNRKGYRYMGVFACSSWEYSQGEDLKGNERRAIVFHLIRPEGSAPTADAADVGMPDQLRRRALEAGSQAVQKTPREAKRLFYERSAAVREYVLRRAEGTCEACGTKAPVRMTDGTPYLEPHHTRRLSDGGPDHPRWVGAVCPNCHREIHYGANGDEKNRSLQRHLTMLESE